MARVAVRARIDEDSERLRAAITDVGPFIHEAGFDAVTVDGVAETNENRVGLLTVELGCRPPDLRTGRGPLRAAADAVRDRARPEGGADVAGETTYALDAGVLDPLLDATVVERQGRR